MTFDLRQQHQLQKEEEEENGDKVVEKLILKKKVEMEEEGRNSSTVSVALTEGPQRAPKRAFSRNLISEA